MKKILATLVLLLVTAAATASSNERAFRVLRPPTREEPHQVWIMPYVTPPISFHIISGTVPPYGIDCIQRQESNRITLECDGGLKLQMNGIDLMQ